MGVWAVSKTDWQVAAARRKDVSFKKIPSGWDKHHLEGVSVEDQRYISGSDFSDPL